MSPPPPPPEDLTARRLRRAGADGALALLVVWAAGAFLFEAHGAHHDWRIGKLHQPTSAYWRMGSAPPERLRRCLAGVDALLAPGAPVVLWDPGADFYRWRWAAYFLPSRDVVQGTAATTAGQLVVVAAGAGGAPPGAERVHGSRWCGLYRLP